MGTASRYTSGTITPSPALTEAEHPLHCLVVTTEEAFAALRNGWNQVGGKMAHYSASLSWSWLWAWWEVFGEGNSPYVVSVFEGDSLVAIFPFMEPKGRLSPFALRRLRQMGYSSELDIKSLTEEPLAVIVEGYEGRAWDEIARHIAWQLRRGRWDCANVRMYLERERADSRSLRHGTVVKERKKKGPMLAPIAPTWDLFRKSLSKSMRDNLPYYPRLLDRDGHQWSVDLYTKADEVRSAVEHLIDLHRLRVEEDPNARHDNHIPDDIQADMLRRALPAMADEGTAILATLTVDGQVVAAQAFLRSGKQLVMHYSGFAQSHSRYSPLLVLQAAVLKEAMAAGISEMNLLFGEALWQKRWNATNGTPMAQCRMASLRPGALLRCAAYALRRELASRGRRRKFVVPTASARQAVSTLTGGFCELHINLARLAPVAHHLVRMHR